VSTQAFQTALARLIVDPDFRDAVRAGDHDALGTGLSARERGRLDRIAHDPGLDINRTLHKGFRLGKLRAMLPLTCRLLGPARLSREVAAFWKQGPPSSFSFIPEALEFCDFLAGRRLRTKYLEEVMAYERAALELDRARPDLAPAQRVSFRHDPSALLATLAEGRRPRAIAPRRCTALGARGNDGQVHWRLLDG
jgi:hypothetical protein